MSVSSSQSYINHGQSASIESIPDVVATETSKQPNRFSKLNSQDSFLTAIQMVRCFAVIGFIGSLVASVLLPASLFATAALASCVLYNKMKSKDSQKLESTEKITQEVSHKRISRTPSMISQMSNASSVSSRSWFPTLTKQLHVLSKIPEVTLKEALLGTIEDRVGDVKAQCCDLLAICYFTLFQKQDDLPIHLHESLIKKSNPEYLKEKVKKYVGSGTRVLDLIMEKVDEGKNYTLNGINPIQQGILKGAKLSAIMEVIADLHEKIEKKDDAKKAREFTQKLLDHEKPQETHFTEDLHRIA